MTANPLPKQAPIGTVIVPIEGSSQEMVVQEYAVMLALALGVPVKALHVSKDPGERAPDFFRYLEELCWRRHVRLEKQVFHGADIVGEIATEAQPNDLIILGTRILGSEYHVGSVAEGLIHRAPCPVQVMRIGPARKTRPSAAAAARRKASPRKKVPASGGWGSG